MAKAEIELKFRVADLQALRSAAVQAGFLELTPRTLERNSLFDTPDRRLLRERCLLRVRQYGAQWVVTHKRPPAGNDDGARYKERLETETTVADGEALGAVFVELGYRPVFHYEKFRTEFADTAGAGHLVVDETPIGNFAELEGPPEWIDRALERLGVSHQLCFTDSYGRMFLEWKRRSESSAENMTFAEVCIAAEPELVGA